MDCRNASLTTKPPDSPLPHHQETTFPRPPVERLEVNKIFQPPVCTRPGRSHCRSLQKHTARAFCVKEGCGHPGSANRTSFTVASTSSSIGPARPCDLDRRTAILPCVRGCRSKRARQGRLFFFVSWIQLREPRNGDPPVQWAPSCLSALTSGTRVNDVSGRSAKLPLTLQFLDSTWFDSWMTPDPSSLRCLLLGILRLLESLLVRGIARNVDEPRGVELASSTDSDTSP